MIEVENDGETLKLIGEARLKHIEELYEKLKDHRSPDAISVLDISRLEDIDVAGAQVIVSFLKASQDVVLRGAPEVLEKKLEFTGLSQFVTK